MARHYSILLSSALGCTLAACGPPNTQSTYQRDKPVFQANDIKDKRVETDPILTAQVDLVEIRQTTVQENMMKINVELVNTDTVPCDFDYKFEWFDGAGQLVDTPSSTWNSQHISAGENLSLVQIAPTPQCKDFRLKLQRGQRH